ncbi:MAG: hypothetical protein J1F07_05585 [Muribaculaceae bacterium]|nr:hypothetical protein [Muribaculaceae bacterium]
MIKTIKSKLSHTLSVGEKYQTLTGRSKWNLIFDFIRCNLKYGCTEEDYIGMEFYKKSNNERRKYLTSRKNREGIYNKFLSTEDKNLYRRKSEFNKYFQDFIHHKWISSISSSENEIIDFINNLGRVIVKPEVGDSGIGIHLINASDESQIKNLIQSIREGNQYIIEEVIIQCEEMASFNPSSVNTCRIETVTDKEGKAHLLNTIVIIGGKGSIVSNTHTGGVMAHIDPDSGIIDSKGRNPNGELFSKHPGTGSKLIGQKIPYWKDVIELALTLAEKRPSARYIGWDIAITANGPELIEGNNQPGYCTQACDMVGRWEIIKKYL